MRPRSFVALVFACVAAAAFAAPTAENKPQAAAAAATPQYGGTLTYLTYLLAPADITHPDLCAAGIVRNYVMPYAEALIKGDVDMIAMPLAWNAPVLRRLFLDPSIHALDWRRADALVALRPHLTKLVLPRGVIDLARDRPPEDLTVVAAKASLVVRENLHPALQYLLLEAATEIHGGPGVFHKAGQFPAAEGLDLPLSEYARDFYRSGRPFLERHLPFWLAAITSQALLLLIPLVALLYPLVRLLPTLYAWGMRRRVFRLYGELKFLEAAFDQDSSGASAQHLFEQLRRLEERAGNMRLPLSFADLLYTLKQHIELVRVRLRTAQARDKPHD